MKINRETIDTGTLEQFADKYNLELYINEREEPINSKTRFYCSFRYCEEIDGAILKSNMGNGRTEGEAIEDYKSKINLVRLRISSPINDSKISTIWRFI